MDKIVYEEYSRLLLNNEKPIFSHMFAQLISKSNLYLFIIRICLFNLMNTIAEVQVF